MKRFTQKLRYNYIHSVIILVLKVMKSSNLSDRFCPFESTKTL